MKDSWIDNDSDAALRGRLKKPMSQPKKQAIRKKRQTVSVHPTSPVTERTAKSNKKPTTSKNIKLSLNFRLPDLKMPKLKIPSSSLKKIKKIKKLHTAIAIPVFAALIFTVVTLNSPSKNDESDVLGGVSQEPDFSAILPKGDIGEVTDNKIGYDPEKKVFSFKDTIGDKEVVVSQQILPETLADDADAELEKIAINFNATQKLAAKTTAFLGTSEQGPQTLIMHKNDLLVFIFSNSKIDEEQWISYIDKLL